MRGSRAKAIRAAIDPYRIVLHFRSVRRRRYGHMQPRDVARAENKVAEYRAMKRDATPAARHERRVALQRAAKRAGVTVNVYEAGQRLLGL
jgi:hypothetical protein